MFNDYSMTINLRCLRLIAGTYVVVQFYPWFKFYFPLFLTHYHNTDTATRVVMIINVVSVFCRFFYTQLQRPPLSYTYHVE